MILLMLTVQWKLMDFMTEPLMNLNASISHQTRKPNEPNGRAF